MPQVTSRVVIDAPFSVVWPLAQNVEEFPSFMADLESVRILEEESVSPTLRRSLTKWSARVKQLNRSITWTEEDFWDEEARECHFAQTQGDFTAYEGLWKFTPLPAEGSGQERTELDLRLDYAFDIPLVGALLQRVLLTLMQQNVDMMASSLQSEAAKRAQA